MLEDLPGHPAVYEPPGGGPVTTPADVFSSFFHGLVRLSVHCERACTMRSVRTLPTSAALRRALQKGVRFRTFVSTGVESLRVPEPSRIWRSDTILATPRPMTLHASRVQPPESLTTALVAAALGANTATRELSAAVCEYVQDLKARGDPPERVVIAVKQAAEELRRLRIPPEQKDALLGEMVTLCIREYYREPVLTLS